MQREDLIESLFINTRALQRAWKSYFMDFMGTEDLSPGQMSVLFYLKNNEPASSKQIGSELRISKSSAAQIIDSLQQLGYVVRETDKFDRRITYTSLSKAGYKRLASLETKRREFFTKVAAGLTDHEITTLMIGQEKMAHAIEQEMHNKTGDIA